MAYRYWVIVKVQALLKETLANLGIAYHLDYSLALRSEASQVILKENRCNKTILILTTFLEQILEQIPCS